MYTLVYEAERPELFLKDAGCRRTVGPGEPIGVRSDSAWNVPEPEIGLVLGADGRVAGGHDRQRRLVAEIEGANPLYLPQAKVYAAPARSGRPSSPPCRPGRSRCGCGSSRRRGRSSSRATSTARMKRHVRGAGRLPAAREPVPAGSVLLTGTGLVPPDDFTLEPGHVVEIEVPGIGILANPVVLASSIVERSPPMSDTLTGSPAQELRRRRVARERERRDVREAEPLAPVAR